MITPVRTLKVGVLCERKDDLLVSVDDIKMVANDAKNKAIDEFAERLKAEYKPCEETDAEIYANVCNRIDKIADQLKGGAV